MAAAMSMMQTVLLVPTLLLVYAASRVFYNIFLHPLRSYPGPLLGRATIVGLQKAYIEGSFPLWIHKLHQIYGPVVRYAPNEISSIEPETWKDVYGYGKSGFQKQRDFYGPDSHGSPPGLLRADNAGHARQRKLVSHAFSDKALREQEGLFKVYVEILLKKLKQRAGHTIDLVQWYNFTTFDIMADLTFGEPLQLLEGSEYTPWVRATFGNMKMVAFTAAIRRWKLLDNLVQRLIPAKAKNLRKMHMEHSRVRVDKRLARKTDRPDIWTYILRYSGTAESDGKSLYPSEMYSNGGLFMLAGTETTATELSGLTYYLLKNPEKMARLQTEVRSAFSSFEDVNITTLSGLTYLNACLEEGLRIYPPVPLGLPRDTPNTGAKIGQMWLPGGTTVSLAMYAAYRSALNFKDPDSFVPERWLPEGQAEYGSDRKEVLNPFSYGPRNCVGKNLAYHEMRLVLASVLLSFDMELMPEAEGWPDQKIYVLWEKKPLMVKLTPVKK